MTAPGGMMMVSGGGGPMDTLPDVLADKVVDFYSLGFNFVGGNQIPASGSQPVSVTLNTDSHFAVLWIAGFASQGGNIVTAVPAPPLTLQIQDGGSGRLLSNTPVHWMTQTGVQGLPYPVGGYGGAPKLFAAGSTIVITVNNLDTANAYNAWLTLSGFKIFGINRDGSSSGGLPPLPY